MSANNLSSKINFPKKGKIIHVMAIVFSLFMIIIKPDAGSYLDSRKC